MFEAVIVMSEYPKMAVQFVIAMITALTQNCMVHCVLRMIGYVLSDACHTEQEYPQDGDRWEKADRLYHSRCIILKQLWYNYRLITAYLLLRVNLDKIMQARRDFDVSSAQTQRVSALDKHQNWSASALFCLNFRAQSKYAVVNLIHTRRK